MQREERYYVLKLKDVEKYLNQDDKMRLARIGRDIDMERQHEGKQALQCVVVESDWPEYEPTWAAIERRVLQEECAHEWVAVVSGDPTWCRQCGASGPCAD